MKSFCIKCFLFFLPFAGESQTLLDLNKKFVELFQQGKYEEAFDNYSKGLEIYKQILNIKFTREEVYHLLNLLIFF